ncbi:MAG: hypothetical protein J2P27_16800 [Actinobacteria bacterium]|nr:hypothetical protein [Actinomycetota bacterium]
MKLTNNGKAAAYQQLLDNFGMTYVELATRVGASWAAQPPGEEGRCWASRIGTITDANLDLLAENFVSESGLPLAMAVSQ